MYFLAHADYMSKAVPDPVLECGDVNMDIRKFFEFIGYYLSEGSISTKKSNYQVSISQSSESEDLDNMIECMEHLGFKYSDYHYGTSNNHSLTICNKTFAKFISNEFGSHAGDKRFRYG